MGIVLLQHIRAEMLLSGPMERPIIARSFKHIIPVPPLLNVGMSTPRGVIEETAPFTAIKTNPAELLDRMIGFSIPSDSGVFHPVDRVGTIDLDGRYDFVDGARSTEATLVKRCWSHWVVGRRLSQGSDEVCVS